MTESSFMSNSNSPSKDCHSPNISMLSEVEMVEQGVRRALKVGPQGEFAECRCIQTLRQNHFCYCLR